MTRAAIEQRLAELRPACQEAQDIRDALMLDYLIAEGFIEVEEIDGELRMFTAGEEWYV